MKTASAPTFRPSAAPAARNARRERAFGTGYGRSSGYAARPGYAIQGALATFRCA